VDLNSAPRGAIARLPGLDDDLAAMIVLLRGHMDGFASLGQLQLMLDLPDDVISDLRDCAVLLPR
jgi:DNA uptake protein ComE-like DNA-binding protein